MNHKPKPQLALAVDFGTSNLKAAMYDDDLQGEVTQKIKPLAWTHGVDVLPHVAAIGTDKIVLGKSMPLHRTVRGLKRHLEEEDWRVFIRQRRRELSAREIAAEEFGWICEKVRFWYHNQLPEQTVLTAPVCFSELQRHRLREAAEKNGLHVSAIVTEPFAGLFSCRELFETSSGEPFVVLVFDFGGGTLDMSLFEITPGSLRENGKTRITALASQGLRFGGEDITRLLYHTYFREEFDPLIAAEIPRVFERRILKDANIPEEEKRPGTMMYQLHYDMVSQDVRQEVMDAVDAFKAELSGAWMYPEPAESFVVSNAIRGGEAHLKSITYAEFEQLLDFSGIRERITDAVDRLLEQAMLGREDVSKLQMIGGSARIPYFRRILQDYFGAQDTLFTEPLSDTAVACGALHYLVCREAGFEIENLLTYDVCVMENGRYRCLRPMSVPCGRDNLTQALSVTPQRLEDGSLCVKMYQVFGDTLRMTQEQLAAQAIYMGCFRLDSEQFEEKPYLLQVWAEEDGALHGLFCDGQMHVIAEMGIALEDA